MNILGHTKKTSGAADIVSQGVRGSVSSCTCAFKCILLACVTKSGALFSGVYEHTHSHIHTHAVLVWVCSIGLGYDCAITIASTVLMNYLTWLVVDKTSFLACCGAPPPKYQAGTGYSEGATGDEFSGGRSKGRAKDTGTRWGGFGTVHAVRKTSSDEFSGDTSSDVISDTGAERRHAYNDSDDSEETYHR